MERKKIGIGYENYKEFVDQDMYYIDKTLLIRDILAQGGKVTLFTRPRRFGKTLALSMLRTFFEAETDPDGKPVDNRRYFEGKKIMERAFRDYEMSARAYHRTLRLARTIADMDDSPDIYAKHLLEAVAYRSTAKED